MEKGGRGWYYIVNKRSTSKITKGTSNVKERSFYEEKDD